MIHLGDITKIDGTKIQPVDCITFGAPCFVAGTLILTSKGYKPIEDVNVGDMVLTHKGNLQRVEKIGNKISDTIILKGFNSGIECTKDHPFYSATKVNKALENVGEWTSAADMLGKCFAIPKEFRNAEIPPMQKMSEKENEPPKLNEDLFYLIGRYLGDGWLRYKQRSDRPEGQTHYQFIVCDSTNKKEELSIAFGKCFEHFSYSAERAVIKFKTTNAPFVRWLKENFDCGSLNKGIPYWALCMSDNYKKALLQGYIDSDGYKKANESIRFTTVSHKLAEGMRLIAESLGYSCTVYFTKVKAKTTIEGREVNQHDTYILSIIPPSKKSFIDSEDFHWYPVKGIIEGRKGVVVYNIQVAEDHSYIANGMVVHNCQDLSVAGKRKGMLHEGRGDEETSRSGLFYEAIRIIKEMRNNGANSGSDESVRYGRYAVYENVPGALSSNKGNDFRCVLEEMARVIDEGVTIPGPPKGKWTNTGAIIGGGYSIAWRIFDAQYWGTPQRRRRICVLADYEGYTAPDILFDNIEYNRSTIGSEEISSVGHLGEEPGREVQSVSQGLPRNSEQSREKTKTVTTNAERSLAASNTVVIEGNGQRPSHQGNGYKESDVMYTLNTTEQHAVAYTYQDREGKPGGGKGGLIQEERATSLRTNNYMTVFQPVIEDKDLILYQREFGGKVTENAKISPTLEAAMGEGGNNQPILAYAVDMGGGKSSCDIIAEKSPTSCTTHYGEPAVIYKGDGASGGETSFAIVGDHENRPTDMTNLVVSVENDIISMDREVFNCGKDFAKTLCIQENGIQPTLVSRGPGAVCYTSSKGGFMTNFTEGTAHTLMATDYKDTPMIAYPSLQDDTAQYWDGTDVAGTLTANNANGSQRMPDKDNFNCVIEKSEKNKKIKYVVRRLTPMECERLQGFPDGWTDIGEWTDSKGKVRKNADSSRYKALGNSICLPSWRFVLQRICSNYDRPATMMSLFDGIGGFPLIWEEINGKGTCIYASEIEEFPIAVTTKRFINNA